MKVLHYRCRRVRTLAAAVLMAMTLVGLPEWPTLNQTQVTFAAAAENQKNSKKTSRKKTTKKKSESKKLKKEFQEEICLEKEGCINEEGSSKEDSRCPAGICEDRIRMVLLRRRSQNDDRLDSCRRTEVLWKNVSGSRKGSLLTGWQTIGGKEYYFSETGGAGAVGRAYAGCTKKVNGISCVFNQEGVFTGCRYAGGTGSFVSRIGEMARHNQRKNNILATVTVAQAILETGYGSVKPHNNLFGIYGGRYSSEAESMEGYNAYIRKYFPSLIGCRNYYTYASRIGNGGYAQAGGYTSALLQIISQNGLTKYAK